jgi:hypothetical protein
VTSWPPDNSLWAGLTSRLGRTIFSLAGMRCITGWEDLRRRLGEPEAILCLGNGPSSEEVGVDRAGFDCLFRVNWIWNERASHSNPDVVFTADLDPPPRDIPVICFPTRMDANRILASYLWRRIGARTDYLVLPELPSSLWDRKWSHRPTNGALMLAAAIHLRPSRLMIAGIDLYLHPRGKYPGAAGEANEYDAIHHRDIDLAFIHAALDSFDGEVDILSQQLRNALAT